jgi:fucose permease
MGLGVGLLPFMTWPGGLAAVACWGLGLGLSIPACNLLVAQVHAGHSASALNLLNFSWSLGAVACPIMLAPFQRYKSVNLYLELLAGAMVLIALALSTLPLPRGPEGERGSGASRSVSFRTVLSTLATPTALALAALFFLYTGVENAVGGWLASYAKRLASGGGMLWVTAPSFFYFALLAGRGLAAAVLRRASELRLTRVGLVMAVAGIVALLASNSIVGVLLSASVVGLGLASVYPVTIAIMTRTVGRSSAGVASVMFALAGLGAACVPWLVGFESTAQSSLKFGLGVALAACALMLVLYLRRWPGPAPAEVLESAEAAQP